MTRRVDSGSRRSPIAVEPDTSQNSTVTVLRTSRDGGVSASSAPQFPQKRNPSGLFWRQLAQIATNASIPSFQADVTMMLDRHQNDVILPPWRRHDSSQRSSETLPRSPPSATRKPQRPPSA